MIAGQSATFFASGLQDFITRAHCCFKKYMILQLSPFMEGHNTIPALNNRISIENP